jgi:hypothetical protein
MSRFPKPFFRASRSLWYVQIAGKQINLGPDEAAARQLYHEIMAKPHSDTEAAPSVSVVVILNRLLDWTSKHRDAGTYRTAA